jgi:hypothetical protein
VFSVEQIKGREGKLETVHENSEGVLSKGRRRQELGVLVSFLNSG